MEVTLDDIIVTKTGDSTNVDRCNRYGQNAAVLVTNDSIARINRANITSTATGATGLFSYGRISTNRDDKTSAEIADSKISTNGSNSAGLMAANGGQLLAQDLTVNTSGTFSPTISSYGTAGTISIVGGNYISTSSDSPTVNCTSDMTIKEATLISHTSSAIVVNGRNKLSLKDCVITANNQILHEHSQQKSGIVLYDTNHSDDISELSIEGSVINNLSGHVFHITNTATKIVLNSVTINNSDHDNILLSVANDGWGGSSNVATVDVHDTELSGHIIIDNTWSSISQQTSKLSLSLCDSTHFTGSINSELSLGNRGEVDLTIRSGCKWTLTRNSYVTSLKNNGQIELGNYKLYVNGEEYEDEEHTDIAETVLRLDNTSYSTTDRYGKLSVTQDSKTSAISATIIQSGRFKITGNGVNTVITVARDVTDVTLNLSDLIIDNTNYAKDTGSDSSIILLQPGADATIVLEGHSRLSGSETCVEYPRPIIRGNESRLVFEGQGILNISDTMPESDVNYCDGITNSMGQINFNSGTVNVDVNGSAIKSSKCTLNFNSGTFNVTHSGKNTIDTVDSEINISDGIVNISDSRESGIVAKYDEYPSSGNVNVSGGYLRLYKISNSGIRCENLNITDGQIDVDIIYDQSGDAIYVPGNNVRNKNTIYPINSTLDRIRINFPDGTHHGFEVGTQGKEYSYSAVPKTDEEHKADVIYTQAASGSINITGGIVNINTRVTGLISNKLFTSGYERCSNNLYIIGSPGHGMMSYGLVTIAGGQVTINAGGNGIHCDGTISINGLASVNIPNAFAGLLGSNVITGTDNSSPIVNISSVGDSIVTVTNHYRYNYDDSRHEDVNYNIDVTRMPSVSNFYLYNGSVTAIIDFANTRAVELRVSPNASKQTIEYLAKGSTINANGYVYLDKGDINLYGLNSDQALPIRQTDGILLNTNVQLLLTGVDPHDKCIPRYGNGVFVMKEDSDNTWIAGSVFKVYTPEGQLIYESELPNEGGTLFFAHTELENKKLYEVFIGDRKYLLNGRQPLR